MILWRQLLDAIGVRWIDRGHNWSRGHVNIPCPWCGPSDPSYHLGIKEADGAYFCLRSHGRHAGRSPYWLLQALGVPSFQIDGLLRDFSDDAPPPREPRWRDPTKWEGFQSATAFPEALTYLRQRGLDPPAVIARRYDMRFAITGPHAWRILLPLKLNFEIVGWTGRAITDRQEPRYFNNDPSGNRSLYIPAYPGPATKIIVLVEGPFDAIAITDAYPEHRIVGIGLLGLNISSERRQHLAEVIALAENPRVLLVLDQDQERNKRQNSKDVLARGTGIPHPESFPLPVGVKDAGEMSRQQITAWLDKLPSQQRGGDLWRASNPNGREHSRTGQKHICGSTTGGSDTN